MTFGRRLSSLEGVLAGDHHRLEQAFQAIAVRACEGDCGDVEADWSAFQDALLGHLDAEEKYIIPALAVDRPAAASVLHDEHARIRVEILRLAFEFDLGCWGGEQVEQFVAMLRAHADREEHTFYPWTDRRPGLRPDDRGTAPGFAALGAG